MRHVRLYADRCDLSGELGLYVRKLDRSGRDDMSAATDGLMIAHDLIEHQNGIAAIGTIPDELEALGAIWQTRGRFCDMRRDGPDYHSPATHIASDITRMGREALCGAEYDHKHGCDGSMAWAVRQFRTHTHELDDSFMESINLARADLREECADIDLADKSKKMLVTTYLCASLHLMRIGARKLAKRFGGNPMRANNQFWAIANAVDPCAKHLEWEGQEFRLSYGNGQAYCEEIFPEE